MRVHVKFFAIFREMTGVQDEWTAVPDGTTVEALWNQYVERNPSVGKLRTAFAVNQKLVNSAQVLGEGDEVGFLPPVSGGAPRSKPGAPAAAKTQRRPRSTQSKRRVKATSAKKIKTGAAMLTRHKLDLGALVNQVAFPGAGAILTFIGVVRDNAHGRAVDHLEYEAYPEMAEASLAQIIAETNERWPDVHVALAHRVGKLKIGEASLIIAVAAPHRPEGYAASRYAIERVKALVPVWKKEVAADGDHWVDGPVAGELAPDKAEKVVREAEYTPF